MIYIYIIRGHADTSLQPSSTCNCGLLTGVRPSFVCSPHRSAAARRSRGFAAVGPAGGRYRSTAVAPVAHQQRRRSAALSNKCEQCNSLLHRKLNTDLLPFHICCLHWSSSKQQHSTMDSFLLMRCRKTKMPLDALDSQCM